MIAGNNVTVEDTIDYCLENIWKKALRTHNRGYEVTICFPNYEGKRSILQHIFLQLSDKLVDGIRLDVGRDAHYHDIDVKFVAMSTNIPKLAVPVCWHDHLQDWTWSDVCAQPDLYSSGSKDIWPPDHYKMRAQRERRYGSSKKSSGY